MSGESARRGEAMRAAGRALALDPESEAATLVSQLMIEPPTKLPSELEDRLSEIDVIASSRQAQLAVRAMFTYLTIIPLALWMGIHDWRPLVAAFALVGLNMLLAFLASRRKRQATVFSTVVVGSAMLLMFGRLFGPFVFLPALLVGVCGAMITVPFLQARPWIALLGFLGAFYGVIVLEATGVWSRTWDVVEGRLIITSGVADLQFAPTVVALVLSTTAVLIVGPMLARSLAVMHRDARRRIEIQAWHLEQLLPKPR